MPVRQLAVVGTGLIGASIGLAARAAGIDDVLGFDVDAAALDAASARGAVEPTPSLRAAVAAAQLIVVAVPPRRVEATIADVLAAVPPDAVVTDTASTKRRVCDAHAAVSRFVGGHPLAGAPGHGAEVARSDLFASRTWIVTPIATTDTAAVARVEAFVEAVGASTVRVAPADHDRLVALTSHVPHALANVLVDQLAAAARDPDPARFVGPSFVDATRVAGANPEMWRDLFLENRDFVADALAELGRRMRTVEEALRAGDEAFVDRWIEQAKAGLARVADRPIDGEPKRQLPSSQ